MKCHWLGALSACLLTASLFPQPSLPSFSWTSFSPGLRRGRLSVKREELIPSCCSDLLPFSKRQVRLDLQTSGLECAVRNEKPISLSALKVCLLQSRSFAELIGCPSVCAFSVVTLDIISDGLSGADNTAPDLERTRVSLIGIKTIIMCVSQRSCEHVETRPSLSGTGEKFFLDFSSLDKSPEFAYESTSFDYEFVSQPHDG